MRHADPGPDQGALFVPPPELERVHAVGDPHVYLPAQPHATQVQAAAAALPRTGSNRGCVLQAIQAAGLGGLTDEEIQRDTRLGANTARPRRHELSNPKHGDPWIVDSGQRRPTSTGSPSIVWIAAELAPLDQFTQEAG